MNAFKRIIIAVTIGVLIVAVGIGSIVLYRLGLLPFSEASAKEEEYTYSMGEFIANLNEPGYKRYIKATIYFGCDSRKLQEELEEKKPQIRNAINNILRSKKLEEVGSVENMEAVTNEMKNKVNEILTIGKVENIYFSDILIQ